MHIGTLASKLSLFYSLLVSIVAAGSHHAQGLIGKHPATASVVLGLWAIMAHLLPSAAANVNVNTWARRVSD